MVAAPGWLLAFIEASQWTVAKSGDHAYVVKHRTAADAATFERAVAFIRENGYEREFAGRSYIYLVVGGHRYWTMHAPVERTTIINRAEEER